MCPTYHWHLPQSIVMSLLCIIDCIILEEVQGEPTGFQASKIYAFVQLILFRSWSLKEDTLISWLIMVDPDCPLNYWDGVQSFIVYVVTGSIRAKYDRTQFWFVDVSITWLYWPQGQSTKNLLHYCEIQKTYCCALLEPFIMAWAL